VKGVDSVVLRAAGAAWSRFEGRRQAVLGGGSPQDFLRPLFMSIAVFSCLEVLGLCTIPPRCGVRNSKIVRVEW
jgi:hypothetical protein